MIPSWLRLGKAFALPICTLALIPLLLGILGIVLWPAWSELGRKRRLGIMSALAGEDRLE